MRAAPAAIACRIGAMKSATRSSSDLTLARNRDRPARARRPLAPESMSPRHISPQRSRRSHQPHQIDAAAPRGRDVEPALHEADSRMRRGDAKIARDRKLRATAHRIAVERGNYRKGEVANLLERGLHLARHCRGTLEGRVDAKVHGDPRRPRNIGHRTRAAWLPSDADRSRCRANRRLTPSRKLATQCIALGGTVDGDAQHVAFGDNLQIAHEIISAQLVARSACFGSTRFERRRTAVYGTIVFARSLERSRRRSEVRSKLSSIRISGPATAIPTGPVPVSIAIAIPITFPTFSPRVTKNPRHRPTSRSASKTSRAVIVLGVTRGSSSFDNSAARALSSCASVALPIELEWSGLESPTFALYRIVCGPSSIARYTT